MMKRRSTLNMHFSREAVCRNVHKMDNVLRVMASGRCSSLAAAKRL